MGAGLAAAAGGLLGAEGGILWVVGGVWLVRGVWGRPPALGWGLACVVAGLRWGTLGLGDVQAATRSVGPALMAGPPLAVAGMGLALMAALVEEAAGGGLRRGSAAERAAAVVAVLALVPCFLVPGAGEPGFVVSLGWWVVGAGGVAAVCVATEPLARRLPAFLAPALAVLGAAAVAAAT